MGGDNLAGAAPLADKRAVVTGAGSGIGRALVEELRKRGAKILATDIDEAALAELGADCPTFRCNVADYDAVEALGAETMKVLGGCDFLFANAGVIANGRFVRMTPAEVDWIMGVNIRGAWSCASVFARIMADQPGGGHICFTGSEHSLGFQHAGAAMYTASKHAVLGLAEVLRAEAPPSLKVSIFCPGLVATALGDAPRPSGVPEARRNAELARRVQSRGMPASEAAARALDGVARGDFYIVTHPHAVRAAERRFEEISDAFGRQAPWEADAERYEVNRVVAEVIAEMEGEHRAEDS